MNELYNETVESLKQSGKVRFFLRNDPRIIPNEFDDRYIANQIEACNYYYHWFCYPDITFLEMLKEQHRIASLGQAGDRQYLIKGYFHTKEGGCDNWDLRDHHAGITRYELNALGVEHAHMDLLRIAPNEYDIYRCEDYFNFIYVESTKKIGVVKATLCKTLITVGDESFVHSFIFRKNRYLYIKHPEADDFLRIQRIIEKNSKILLAYKTKPIVNREKLLTDLASYYQLFLVWMPFAHINNSLVWGQINSILQHFGLSAVPHGRLDTYAMLLSTKNFVPIFIKHILNNQIT